EQWLTHEFPAIKERAKKEGATILWGDETGVQNTASAGRSYSPSGKTPVIRKSGKQLKANMISAITNRGEVRFMIYSEKMNQQMFIRFLERLISTFPGKVMFIIDNLKVHHGKKVAEWVAKHSEQIELFFIPVYSPDLNPDEYLNRDLKKNVNGRVIARTESELKMNLLSFMRKLQKLPDRVMSYFNSSPIKYAA
ncbi:MAG: IS630 family transposase, partial [Chlorobiaceae bacterium]|nr:IS630 family transposase [Chlorobiaceae bacterium]